MKTVRNPKKVHNDSVAQAPTAMAVPPPVKTYEIIVGPSVKVTTDKNSKTRVVSFPFEFTDQSAGVLIICRVKDEEWVPVKNIKSIKIEFNEN